MKAFRSRVAILEVGGDEKETAHASTGRLASDSRMGHFYHDLSGRQISGNLNLCNKSAQGAAHGLRLPLKAVDFEHRKWMPETGWPVSSSDFDGYWQLTDEAIRHEPLLGLSTLFRY
jgi:hypothetical protein